VPGFERFNVRVSQGEFYLPNAVRDELRFATPEKKARFTVHSLTHTNLAAGRFLLTTIRSHDQFNTTIYGLDDRYRGIYGGRQVVLMNQEDMAEQGYRPMESVDITSHFEGEARYVSGFFVVPYEIPRQCVAAYFPEANPLVALSSFAEGSRQPAYKSVEVSFQKSAL
jgi:anaerobic selenocysteine-containing dehydrogenase